MVPKLQIHKLTLFENMKGLVEAQLWCGDDGLGGLPVADLIVAAQRDTKSGGVVLSVAFPRPGIYLSTPLCTFTIHPPSTLFSILSLVTL